jgi:hypothetical protein
MAGAFMGIISRWRVGLVVCATVLTLAGCAGQTIQSRMNEYIGQPASVLFNRLGLPISEQTVAGRKVYIWTRSNLVEGTNYGCKIRAIVDAQDIITSFDWEGNEGGCGVYASRLR